MINNIGAGNIRINTPDRVWTNDSVNLNKTTKEEFVKEQLDKAEISSHSKKTEAKSGDGGSQKTITADDFARHETIIATDRNSTLHKELGKQPEAKQPPDNSPSALLMEENGNVSSAVEASGSKMPDDLVKTTQHKTATIGTFNIEWLGGCPYKNNRKRKPPERTDADYQKVAGVIKDSGACLLGLQEVVTEEALFKVLKNLPDWGYILSKNQNQKVALIFDKSRVQFDANSVQCLDEMSDAKTFNYGNLRPPLSVYMKVDNFDCNMIVVHQKSGFFEDSKEIRNKQSEMMNHWINNYLETNNDKDLIIMGDFNDFVGSDSLNDISRGGILHYATEDMPKGEFSNIPHKGIIDHIGYTTVKGGADEEVKKGTVRTIDHKKYPGYTKWGSDHKPVLLDVETGKDND